ncbi:MAG: RING finger domain-containing protein, partial [Candidatus Hodarchaeales archaeon]
MKNTAEVFEFTSEAEKLLSEYLAEIQNQLTVERASPRETKEITEEFREHILQAYWKETGSKSVTVKPLHELLTTMGDPHEIASEYLVDRSSTGQGAVRRSSGGISSYLFISKHKSLGKYMVASPTFFYFVLPLIMVIGIYFLLILLFSHLQDLWIVLFVISDILLVIPLVWYHFRWKPVEGLRKWRIATPRRMQIYLIAGIILLILSAMLLPSLRGRSGRYQDYYAEDHEAPPGFNRDLTLEGSWTSENWDDYYYEFYINSQFLILAYLMQLFFVGLFLLAAFRAPIQWQQADVRMILLDVKPPIHIDDTGVIKIQTKNYNPVTFPQVILEVQDQSPGFQTAIEPSSRSAFGQQDTVGWLIWFTPKLAGNLAFGRIVLRLGDSLTVSSPRYSLLVQEQPSFLDSRGVSSQPEIGSGFPRTPDLTASCGVCRQPFNSTDRVASCSLCGSVFHLPHLQEWFKGHNTCPNCSRQANVSELDRTYGTLVLERLEQLESELRHL